MGVVPMLGLGVAWWQRLGTHRVNGARPACARRAPELGDERLLGELRRRFVKLQAAWDAFHIPALRDMTTEPMLRELCPPFPVPSERPYCTQVLTLQAEMMGFEHLASGGVASVAFPG